MKPNKKFSALEIIIAVVSLVLLAALIVPRLAQAQPYFTNSSTIYGGQVYNQNYVSPAAQRQTIANQYASGIVAGVGQTSADGTVTNVFGTNIFTVPPIVVVTQTTNGYGGGKWSSTNLVTSVTTSNFVYSDGIGLTNVWHNWIAIGH